MALGYDEGYSCAFVLGLGSSNYMCVGMEMKKRGCFLSLVL